MQHSDSEFLWDKLPCGLRVIYSYADSGVSYCGFAVNAGTRDEEAGQDGLAHYVEHLLFKGTQRRKAWHILNLMESVGGEINAYTSKEETVIYSVHLEPDLKRSTDLMADIIMNSKFPKEESDREKEVIADEINSYRDNPGELIYDEFENIIFNGHPLGHNILGDSDSIKNITPEDGKSFVKKNYTPGNMVFFFNGKTPYKKVLSLLERSIGSYFSGDTVSERKSPNEYNPFCKTVNIESYQAHAIIGCRCYDMFDKRRIPLFLISNMLAGPGMNSILNVALRERRGYVYNVESSTTCYTDTGGFAIYFGTDPVNINRCFSVIKKGLAGFRDKSITSSKLNAAKKQFIGQLFIGRENRESLSTAWGKKFLHHNRCDTLRENIERIERITPQQLLDTANEIFSEDRLSYLIFK